MQNQGPTGQKPTDAESDLRKYYALVHASEIGTWEYFPDTGTVSFNDVYFAMLGRDIKNAAQENNLQSVWFDLLHPDDKNSAVNKFETYVQRPTRAYENQFRMRHADGSWR